MTRLVNWNGAGAVLGATTAALLLPIAMTAAGSGHAVAAGLPGAEKIQIVLPASGDQEELRRRLAVAARRLCRTGGVADLHGGGERRCRDAVIAQAHRQLEDPHGSQLARAAR